MNDEPIITELEDDIDGDGGEWVVATPDKPEDKEVLLNRLAAALSAGGDDTVGDGPRDAPRDG